MVWYSINMLRILQSMVVLGPLTRMQDTHVILVSGAPKLASSFRVPQAQSMVVSSYSASAATVRSSRPTKLVLPKPGQAIRPQQGYPCSDLNVEMRPGSPCWQVPPNEPLAPSFRKGVGPNGATFCSVWGAGGGGGDKIPEDWIAMRSVSSVLLFWLFKGGFKVIFGTFVMVLV